MSYSSSKNHGTSPGLLLTIAGVGDCAVDFDRRATVSDLVSALGADDSSVLVVQRTGRSLHPSAPLQLCDLRCGDTVEFEATVHAETVEIAVGPVSLKVLTGIDKGTVITLHDGENRVGRAADNDIVLLDPGVSRHHAAITVENSTVSVVDSGSTNGVLVGDTIIDQPTSLRAGDRVLIGQIWFEVCYEKRTVEAHQWDSADSQFGPVVVTPGTRPHKPYVGETITFPAAPSRGRLWRRAGSDGFEAAVNLFERSLQNATAALVKEIDAEWSARLGEAPSVTEIAEAVSHDQTRLWPRGANDPLITRVGLCSLPSRIRCVVPDEGDEVLQAKARSIVDQHRNVDGVPVTVDFTEAHTVLVAGEAQRSRELAYGLLGQLAAQHSPQRLCIWGLLGSDRVDEWEWLKWLPHCAGVADDGGFQRMTADPDKYEAVVDRLIASVNGAGSRAGSGHGAGGTNGTGGPRGGSIGPSGHGDGQPAATNHILLVDGQAVVPDELQTTIESLVVKEDARVSAFVVGQGTPSRQVELPFGQDGSIVNIDADYASLEVVGGDSIDAVLGINYEVFGLEDVEALARLISCAETDAAPPAMFWSAAGYESAEISDLDSLIRGADPAILVEQWSDDANPGRLTARLGANENGPVRVDLRDLGPHALISGDLEGFLPAWICSLATSYSPADLNFYLIDSTGGSVFRCCQDLPHTIGSLYDSSLLQVKPALAMLSAELDRREAVLSSLALDTVENLGREGRSSPFPYLVVAVDRVEQLRAASFRISGEVVSLDPVAEMLTLSERGQQLGVHLLLGSDGDQPLTDRIPLRLHASRTGSSTLTVGQAPSVSFSAILASPRPEIVVSSYAIDFVDELSRAPLRVDEDDDLERVTNLITSAHEYSGGSLPASLS